MQDDIMRFLNGDAPRPSRAVVSRAKQTRGEVQIAGFMADGAMALAGHIMEGVVDLDAQRRMLAGNDPILNTLLADIEQTALFSVKKIQTGLYSQWKL
jgi:hypothetical protein